MKSFKAVAFVLLFITACVGSDPGSVSSLGVTGDGSDQKTPAPDEKKAEGSSNPEEGTPTDPGKDSGGSNPVDQDSGSGANDSGGSPVVTTDSGGGPVGVDSGGGGVDSGGGGNPGVDSGGGGAIVSNSHNWSGWNDPLYCPAWNPTPYSWREPRTSYIGSQSCGGGDVLLAGGLYESFLGPSASASAQAAWLAAHPACATCAISNWSDAIWGPVVRTPNGHYVLNQAGCIAMKDPTRKSCALSHWQFHQCGKEACDSSANQIAYQTCVDNASNVLGGSCGEASYGLGKANNVLAPNSTAWSECVSTGLPDNAKQIAARIVTGQCY